MKSIVLYKQKKQKMKKRKISLQDYTLTKNQRINLRALVKNRMLKIKKWIS